MSLYYYAYGLVIRSDITLSAQTIRQQQSDVQIKLSNLDHIHKKTITNKSNQILGRLPGVGKFLIRHGKEILIDQEPNIDAKILSPCILGSAMSVLLQQRGFLVLHASCVVINNSAVAFLGNSGEGKSTICSAFHTCGHKILTDDVMAVRIEQDGIWVVPSIPEIKLRSDSAALMNYREGTLSPIHPLTKKVVHQIQSGFLTQPVPLKQIYVLAKGEQNQIQPLSSQNAFIELVRHTRAVKTLRSQALEQAHFQKCVTLAQNVNISKLFRKFTLSDIFNVVELVEKHLQKT